MTPLAMSFIRTFAHLLVLLTLSIGGGCASTRIAVAEQFGYAKREQLVDRVMEARDEQEEAKVQFKSALDEFLAVTGANVGDLEARYEELSDAYDASVDQADDVRDRIAAVERVAAALFKEWEAELEQYSSDTMRRSSERQLNDTRQRYDRLIGAMKQAEAKMDPVLAAFKDQVLFLKHNLNARAIASLQDSVNEIQSDVARLISDMEASIRQANEFIQEMGAEAPAG